MWKQEEWQKIWMRIRDRIFKLKFDNNIQKNLQNWTRKTFLRTEITRERMDFNSTILIFGAALIFILVSFRSPNDIPKQITVFRIEIQFAHYILFIVLYIRSYDIGNMDLVVIIALTFLTVLHMEIMENWMETEWRIMHKANMVVMKMRFCFQSMT